MTEEYHDDGIFLGEDEEEQKEALRQLLMKYPYQSYFAWEKKDEENDL